ncbi:Crp/Fnr family transcriptional regulator [Kutzneria kofuensis]|jgi:CRP-like cAMP-binding protein
MGNGQEFRAGVWPRATLLGRLPAKVVDQVLTAGVERKLCSGRPLIREGELEGYAFVLVRGIVKVTAATETGEALLAIRVGGDLVGEMGVLEKAPRSATVTACTPVWTRVVHRNEFLDLMRRSPDFSVEVAAMISWRLRWANRRRLEFAGQPARVRVCRVLDEIVDTYGARHGSTWSLGVPLTQAEIASLAGIALRTAEKELGQLEQDGVVVRRYRATEVADRDALRLIANGGTNPH